MNFKIISSLLLLSVFAQPLKGVSIIRNGDVQITVDNGLINCDTIICPSNTNYCEVSNENDPQNWSLLIRLRSCFDINGQVLAEERITKQSNGKRFNDIARVYSNGASSVQSFNGGGGGRNSIQSSNQNGGYYNYNVNENINTGLQNQLSQMQQELSQIGPRVSNQVQGITRNINAQIAQTMSGLSRNGLLPWNFK